MKFTTSLAVCASLVASARAGVVPPTEAELAMDKRQAVYGSGGDTGCVKGVHIIAVGGQYTGYGNLSLLQPLVDSVKNAIPNSNAYVVGYPDNAVGGAAISAAMPIFSSHFTQYAAACPKTKIVTIGYSTGGATVMNTFCGGAADWQSPPPLSPDLRTNLLANIIYGDLTFIPGERSSAGTCTQGTGGYVPRKKPGKCYPFGRKTKSYCDVNDPQCCTLNEGDPAIHFTYPANYDSDSLKFVLAKWHYYNNNVKGQ